MSEPTLLSIQSIRRLSFWSVVLSLPAWLGILVLYVIERLSLAEAAASVLIALILMAALVFTRIADFERIARYAEAALENPTLRQPDASSSETSQRLMSAVSTLQRKWADERSDSAALSRARQNILDGLPDALLLLDQQRRVVGANAGAHDFLDREPGTTGTGRELVGRDLAGVIRDPKVLEAVEQALAQNKRTEAQFSVSVPVERIFRALFVPLRLGTRDGTALMLALQEQTERLKMDRMRADFVANASHELRTPLTAILGFVETLRGPARDDTEARDKFLVIMLKQANRMTRLIDDLLSLSRIELREHTRPTDHIDVGAVLRTTAELLDVQARERKSAINITMAPDLPLALGDASELGQVFYNLTSNALKYGGGRGPVELTAQTVETRPPTMPGQGPCLKISVRDYGEGIAPEHLPRLTERFYRVDTARSRELGGTGLGLAIVKHITGRHRGLLLIESEVGKGSTFSVFLPMATSPEVGAKPQGK